MLRIETAKSEMLHFKHKMMVFLVFEKEIGLLSTWRRFMACNADRAAHDICVKTLPNLIIFRTFLFSLTTNFEIKNHILNY